MTLHGNFAHYQVTVSSLNNEGLLLIFAFVKRVKDNILSWLGKHLTQYFYGNLKEELYFLM